MSSTQEAMEGEPVRKHVAQYVESKDKPVLALFLARDIDINTYETFRRGVWYNKNDDKLALKILPVNLEQFMNLLEKSIDDNQLKASDTFFDLTNQVFKNSLVEAPAWRDDVISETVKNFLA